MKMADSVDESDRDVFSADLAKEWPQRRKGNCESEASAGSPIPLR